jgi:hypothetical protein
MTLPSDSSDSTRRGNDRIAGIRAIARLLDSAVRVPGTNIRFGLDPLLGLVPGLGDVAGAVLTGYIVLAGARLGVPRVVVMRMLMNVGIDTVVGLVPVLGDLFDVGWKANMRNMALIEQHAAQPEIAKRSSTAVVVGAATVLVALAAGGIALAWFVVRAIVSAFS